MPETDTTTPTTEAVTERYQLDELYGDLYELATEVLTHYVPCFAAAGSWRQLEIAGVGPTVERAIRDLGRIHGELDIAAYCVETAVQPGEA